MGFRFFLAAMMVPALAAAQQASPEKALELFKATQGKVKSLSPDPGCFTCTFTMAANAEKDGADNICEDLFGASCLSPDGKSKYQGRQKALTRELGQIISAVRDKAAKEMGFKDFDDALRSKLSAAGLDLKDSPDPEALKSLKMENTSSEPDLAKKLYPSVEKCEEESRELLGLRTYGVTDPGQLREAIQKIETFHRKYRDRNIGLSMADIPTFLTGNINSKCESLKSSPNMYKPEENQKAAKTCENLSQLRRQAIQLFRLEGSPRYKEQAEKFVRDNYLDDLKFSSSNGNPYSNPYSNQYSNEYPSGKSAPSTESLKLTPEQLEVAKLSVAVLDGQRTISGTCQAYSKLMEDAGRKVFQDLATEVNKSKPMVEGLIDSFYTEERKKLANSMLRESSSDVKDLVSKFVKNPVKRGEIQKGFDSLKLNWIEKPKEAFYKKASDGTLVLDEEKAGLTGLASLGNDVYWTFNDPALSFFKTMNADYLPTVNFGKTQLVAERVNMMPAFLHLVDKGPYVFLAVLAHEAGHRVGPRAGRLNGFDLANEYKDLIACYKSNESINMQSQQADEAIADYVSSEVLARQISKLPPEKRRQALVSSMEGFCIFDDEAGMHLNCKGSHPDSSLRIAGIYGANPNLRKVIGCEGESTKFKSCGLSVANGSEFQGKRGKDQTKSAPVSRGRQ